MGRMNFRSAGVKGEGILGDQSSTLVCSASGLDQDSSNRNRGAEDLDCDLLAEPIRQMGRWERGEIGRMYQGCPLDLCFPQQAAGDTIF